MIREAQKGESDLAVLLLVLSNACGTILHKLVKISLARHHISGKIRNILISNIRNFILN